MTCDCVAAVRVMANSRNIGAAAGMLRFPLESIAQAFCVMFRQLQYYTMTAKQQQQMFVCKQHVS